MYDEIKQALGPSQKKTAPLNFATDEIIQDRTQQMERWVEHDYSELSARENMVSLEALNAIDCLPVLEDLEGEPTKVELKEALGYLHLEKCAGRIGYSACGREREGVTMMRDANIVTLYKNKGARRACNNYQGISLLSIAIKLFARVVLKSLQVLAERFYS